MEASLAPFDAWLLELKSTLDSINMPLDTWQAVTPFDFSRELKSGISANVAALKANRFWWRNQNQRINQECHLTPNCRLPCGHAGTCEQV